MRKIERIMYKSFIHHKYKLSECVILFRRIFSLELTDFVANNNQL